MQTFKEYLTESQSVDKEDIALVVKLMKDYVKLNRTQGGISQCGLIYNELLRQGKNELARTFKNWSVKSSTSKTALTTPFGPEAAKLYADLQEIDRRFKMPDWGTRGT